MPEANFDGIVGPTHNYAGLSLGNVASASNRGAVARPREAALQGLAKAAALARLGLVQGWIPPQERPHVPTLRALGFDGSDEVAIARAAADAPHLLARASSASAMWTANAATVTPSADSGDGRPSHTSDGKSRRISRNNRLSSSSDRSCACRLPRPTITS